MPAITTNDLKNGITLDLDNGLFQVVEFQHVKPGKGGAFVRTKLRNVRTGSVLERTFNAGIRVEQAIVDRQDMQFLYKDGDDYVFMNTSTYDQITVPRVALGDAADYLVEQAVAQIAQYQDQVIGVEIPASVELTISQTDPGVQGDRVSGARKPALYLLYEAQAKDISAVDALESQIVEPDALTATLVRGVVEHRQRLDAAIAARATGWALDRMPVLDLNVLRLGAFELAERTDVPVAVVIDEAVELAKRFSTDNSGRFVNGVLSALVDDLRPPPSPTDRS